MRVALVGLGDAGMHHARALAAAAGVEWTAICARSTDSVERFARARVAEGGTVPDSVERVAGLDRLLEADLCDAVILATPDALHAEQIVACASAGVSVLVEKPLALNVADARRAVDACRQRGVSLGVGYHLRHHAGHRRVHSQLAALGALKRIAIRWAWPDPAVDGWRARGALASTWSLAALGTHGIDLAMWLAGSSEVVEHAALLHPSDGVDQASELSFRLGNGVLVHVSASVTHRAPSIVRITGESGEIVCERTLGARGGGHISSADTTVEFTPTHPYTEQLEAFARRVASVHAGSEPDPEPLAAALANVALIGEATSR